MFSTAYHHARFMKSAQAKPQTGEAKADYRLLGSRSKYVYFDTRDEKRGEIESWALTSIRSFFYQEAPSPENVSQLIQYIFSEKKTREDIDINERITRIQEAIKSNSHFDSSSCLSATGNKILAFLAALAYPDCVPESGTDTTKIKEKIRSFFSDATKNSIRFDNSALEKFILEFRDKNSEFFRVKNEIPSKPQTGEAKVDYRLLGSRSKDVLKEEKGFENSALYSIGYLFFTKNIGSYELIQNIFSKSESSTLIDASSVIFLELIKTAIKSNSRFNFTNCLSATGNKILALIAALDDPNCVPPTGKDTRKIKEKIRSFFSDATKNSIRFDNSALEKFILEFRDDENSGFFEIKRQQEKEKELLSGYKTMSQSLSKIGNFFTGNGSIADDTIKEAAHEFFEQTKVMFKFEFFNDPIYQQAKNILKTYFTLIITRLNQKSKSEQLFNEIINKALSTTSDSIFKEKREEAEIRTFFDSIGPNNLVTFETVQKKLCEQIAKLETRDQQLKITSSSSSAV